MIVAVLELTAAHGFTSAGFIHKIGFDTLDAATRIFHEVAELLRRREARANDLPTLVEIEGSGQKVSMPLETVQSITLVDYVFANEQEAGVKEAFPHLFLK